MRIPMTHLISSVQDFEIIAACTLRVAFDDGKEQIINFEPVLRGELYGPLRDADLFRRGHLDLEGHTVAWRFGCAGLRRLSLSLASGLLGLHAGQHGQRECCRKRTTDDNSAHRTS